MKAIEIVLRPRSFTLDNDKAPSLPSSGLAPESWEALPSVGATVAEELAGDDASVEPCVAISEVGSATAGEEVLGSDCEVVGGAEEELIVNIGLLLSDLPKTKRISSVRNNMKGDLG
jgi:hypothetical protein